MLTKDETLDDLLNAVHSFLACEVSDRESAYRRDRDDSYSFEHVADARVALADFETILKLLTEKQP